jgi:hypothetical protein
MIQARRDLGEYACRLPVVGSQARDMAPPSSPVHGPPLVRLRYGAGAFIFGRLRSSLALLLALVTLASVAVPLVLPWRWSRVRNVRARPPRDPHDGRAWPTPRSSASWRLRAVTPASTTRLLVEYSPRIRSGTGRTAAFDRPGPSWNLPARAMGAALREPPSAQNGLRPRAIAAMNPDSKESPVGAPREEPPSCEAVLRG